MVRRGAVLHARAAHHRCRARLRPHHERDRRRADRLVRHRHALLRHAQGAPGAAQPGRRESGRHHLPHRGARRRPGQGAPARPGVGRRHLQGALRVPLGGPVQPGPRPGHGAGLPRRNPARRGGQGRALLLHVRTQVLLDEDHPGRARVCGCARPGLHGRGRGGAAREGGRIPRARRRDLRGRGGQPHALNRSDH